MPDDTTIPPELRPLYEAQVRLAAQEVRVNRLRKAKEVLGKVADHLKENPPSQPGTPGSKE